jgi:hypothetical protein
VIVLLILTGLVFAVHPISVAYAEPIAPVVGVWSQLYESSNVTDPSLGVRSSVVFGVNVTGAPAFNGYEFSLYYDPGFLKAQSVDFTTGTVFNAPFAAKNDLSVPGVVSVSVVNLGSAFDSGSGVLMHVSFLVTGVGVSPLTLDQGIADPGVGTQSWTRLVLGYTTIPVTTSDGYFKNDVSRLGPVSDFELTPINSSDGDVKVFDSSQSFDPGNSDGANKGVAEYSWDFGDGVAVSTFFPVIAHRFGGLQAPGFSGSFSVRLTVIDSDDSFEGMITRVVTVSSSLAPSTNFLVFTPGAAVPLFAGGSYATTVTVFSLGGFQGNVSLSTHIFPNIPNGPVVSILPSVELSPDGFAGTFMIITTNSSTPPGNHGVIITGTSGTLSNSALARLTILRSTSFPRISISNYFTDAAGNGLPIDSNESPSVGVVLVQGTVRSTTPGQVLAWMNLTNTGTVSFSSLNVVEELPLNWTVSPSTGKSQGAVHIFFEFGNRTLLDITRTATFELSGTSPESLDLTLDNITRTLAGKTLEPGESILLSAKLDYGLTGMSFPTGEFPLRYRIATAAVARTPTGFSIAATTASAIFHADAKIMGDVNGDLKVNVLDLALVAYSFNSRPGDTNWNSGPEEGFQNSCRVLLRGRG